MDFKNFDTGMRARVSECDHRGFSWVVTLTDMDSGCLVGRRYAPTLAQALAYAQKCTRWVAANG